MQRWTCYILFIKIKYTFIIRLCLLFDILNVVSLFLLMFAVRKSCSRYTHVHTLQQDVGKSQHCFEKVRF